MLSEALTAARAIEDSDDRARALGGLAPHLPAELLAEALSGGPGDRGQLCPRACPGRAGAAPAGGAGAEVLSDALTAARAIEDSSHRARALGGLAPHLPGESCCPTR